LGQVIKYENCNHNAKSILVTGLTGRKTSSSPAENPLDIVVDRQKNIYVLQSSEIEDQYHAGMTNIYKYYASDGYVAETRSKVLTLNEWTSRLAIDKKDNIYASAAYYYFLLDNYNGAVKRFNANVTTNAGMYCIAVDNEQNIFYGFSAVDKFIRKSQYGYRVTGLPDGLVLNANGTITGTPTTVKSETNYEVTSSSFYGSSAASLQITVIDPIPQFNYAEANQILTAGVNALNIDLVKTGGPVNSYSISPITLPTGISFNTNTGKLSGTPTVINDNVLTYTISATNTGGTGTTTVTFKIIDKAPTSLVYPASYVLYLGKQFNGETPSIAGGAVTKWSISPALPQGLFIDVKTGVINGYPMLTSAAKAYTVTAENSGGSTTATVNLEVKDLPPNISYALRSSFTFKKDITITPINAPSNDGGPIVSYSALPVLPAGLSLNTTTGEITGKPTQLKSPTDYKIKANGGQWGEDIATVSIEIISLPPNKISYDDLITIVKGTAITKIKPTYTTNDGDPVERFSITPELPQGLTFNTSNGEITGTPTEIFGSNGQLFYVKAENGAGSNTAMLVLVLKDLASAIVYNNNNIFTKGTNVDLDVNSTGGAVEKYRITPALPDGLLLDSLSGKISGIPTVLDTKTQYTVTGTNYGNPQSTSSFYITLVDKVPEISYTAPQVLNRTVAIDPITVSSTGGLVVSYAVSPNLPAGLSLNTTTGTISGTPTTSTVAKDYTITATNTGGTHNTIINFAVKNAKPVIAYGTVHELYKNVEMSDIEPVSTGGNQNTFSITPALPNGLTLNTGTGVISGTPSSTTSLVTYTLKAVNDGGEDAATFTIIVNEKPPGQISYAELTTDFYVGYAISPVSPIVEDGGGEIAYYSIAPTNLAPGLTFNTNTGIISGKPTADFIRSTYTVTAHNSGGISQTTITFAVIKLSATISKTDVKCFGSSTGTATANVIGGKAPYRYTWSSNAGNSQTVTGLKAGTYTVTISDANNTTITASVTINEPTLLEITNLSKVDNQQYGGTNGSASATVSGGVAPYTYAWSLNSSTTATAINLAEGIYTLTVTDANNCSISKTVVIDAPPAAPSDLVAQAGNAKNVLNWQANTETDLASYKVYGGTTSSPSTLLQIITAPITNYTHENLINGTNYYYRITAVDKAGYESTHSSQANATPQGSQLITFAISQAKTYGDADFNAGAIASSGLTVSYTTDNPLVATVVAGKIHIVGAGTVNITASQAGNGTWLAATSQSQELTVNKRSLTVTATGNNKVYDGNLTSTVNLSDNRILGDQLSASYSFAIFDDKNVGTSRNIAVFGINITGVNAGNYTVNATTNTTASITAKPLIITADDKTNIQGLPLPAFTANYNGFVSGEDSNILTAKPSLSTNAISNSSQGTYPITAVGATAQNYSITHANGTLTVQPGTPTSIALSQRLLLENQPSGTTAGTLSSIAPDPNAIFTYTLVTGTGSTDNNKFSIQGNIIHTLSAFDYETQQNFNIRVRTSTQYGASLEQAFTIVLTDVNEAPTLADINNQTICFTPAQQSVPLSGITPGPETHQTTTVSVSSSNNNLFSTLGVGNVNNGNAILNYRIANGQSGTATITVTVTDNGGTANNGVNAISKSFTITVNPLPQVTITSELGTNFSKGQTTKLTATGGVGYQWSGPAGIIGGTNTSSLDVRPESASGTYTVVVTSAAGCTSTQSITLTTIEDIVQISGTNIITPNGDGVNDNLIIKNVDLYSNNELEIFDRAGRKIYSKKGYQNEWNGSFNGIPLAEGTYYYIINFIGVGKYKGFITIIKD
jgi:gliding motility-associated-like protein